MKAETENKVTGTAMLNKNREETDIYHILSYLDLLLIIILKGKKVVFIYLMIYLAIESTKKLDGGEEVLYLVCSTYIIEKTQNTTFFSCLMLSLE